MSSGRHILPLGFILLIFLSRVQAREPLWNGQAPDGAAGADSADALIEIYKPQKANGTAIVICPGGGYQRLCVEPEGRRIAEWLSTLGITGVVLEYRLPAHRGEVPLLDAQRAIQTIRSRATQLGLRADRIGIMGFSAGGHLAATAATHFEEQPSGNPADPVSRISTRPDFAILIYPVITMGGGTHAGSRDMLLGPAATPEKIKRFSCEMQVVQRTPPVFLAHAMDDKLVSISNSQLMAEACLKQKIPVRLLELPSGGHGLNGYQGPMWEEWKRGSIAWLAEMKLIPELPLPAEKT